MRVITGTARGRRLKEPQGMDIRPTTDKVKESMFSILQFDIEGRRVLDLFGGTGQLGIEALSRGASEVVFVDKSAAALKLIRENLELCGLSDRARSGTATPWPICAAARSSTWCSWTPPMTPACWSRLCRISQGLTFVASMV